MISLFLANRKEKSALRHGYTWAGIISGQRTDSQAKFV